MLGCHGAAPCGTPRRHAVLVMLACCALPHCVAGGKCDNYACNNGGTCQVKGGKKNKYAECKCAYGYTGNHCSQETGCDGNPCGSHGDCTANGGSHRCDCDNGWSGNSCDHATGCDNSPDCGQGTCVANGGSHTCDCDKCYKGPSCAAAIGCVGQNCHRHGDCAVKRNDPCDYTCTCDRGWGGNNDCDECLKPCPNAKPANQPGLNKCSGGSCLGDSCTATCRTGYTSSGTAKYTCSADGSWGGGPVQCTPVSCTGAPTRNAKKCSGKYEDGKTCTVTCKPGYKTEGSGGYTCDSDGSWVYGDTTCVLKLCPTENPTDDDNVQCISGSFKDTRDMKCHGGYEGTGSSTYRCANTPGSDTGHWVCDDEDGDGCTLSCAGITCAASKPGSTGSKVSHALQCKGATYKRDSTTCDHGGNAVTCKPQADPDASGCGLCDTPCLPGYNSNDGWTPYTCDTNGHWTSGRLTCEPKKCSGHPADQDTGGDSGEPHTDCTGCSGNDCNDGEFGDTCTAQCTIGYIEESGTGSSPALDQYTCMNSGGGNKKGHWGGGTLKCSGKTCNNEPPGATQQNPNGVPNSRNCDTGKFEDSGDPNHVFTGSICVTTVRGKKIQHAVCKDGYEEPPDSGHDYVCDHTGHWVAGTKKSYGPPTDPDGQGMKCLGQICPASSASDPNDRDGETPHDVNMKWPLTNFEPCYKDEDSKSLKKLYYSDTCKDAGDSDNWGENCHCDSSCVSGYTDDGTKNGNAARTFRCLQRSNVPYFSPAEPLVCKAVTCGDVMDTENHKKGGHMPEREGDDRDQKNRLVPSSKDWTKTFPAPRCGAPASLNPRSLAPDDDTGTMRYDRDGENNKCFASCAEGYTAHDSSQTEQIFTCNGDGAFSGSLKCSIISCDSDALDAISTKPKSATSCAGCTEIGAHANRSTWEACKTNNHFNDQCVVECATGFTNSYVGGNYKNNYKSYKCVAIPDGKLTNGDDKFMKHGVWTYGGEPVNKGTKNKSPINLQCKAVKCDPLTRPHNTMYSTDDYLNGDRNYKDDEWLRIHQVCSSAGYGHDESDGNNAKIAFFKDHCRMECLSGWYPALDPKPKWPQSNARPALDSENRSVTYTCAEPGPDATSGEQPTDENDQPCPRPGSAKGVWCPGPCCTGLVNQSSTPNEVLFCKEGTLDPTQTRVNLTHIDAGLVAELDWPPPGLVSHSITAPSGPGLDGEGERAKAVEPSPFLGWRFGGSIEQKSLRGPQYKFIIETRDTYGNPRDYNNLGTESENPAFSGRGRTPHPDYVLVVIKRVPIEYLKKSDRNLQPTMKWDMVAYPSKPDRTANSELADQLREYGGQTTHGDTGRYDSSDTHEILRIVDNTAKAKGRWVFNHQFSEHGVFYLSVYVCSIIDKDPCKNQDAGHLVPGTGLTQSPYDEKTKERKVEDQWTCKKTPNGLRCPNAMDNTVKPKPEPSDDDDDQVPASAFTVCPQGTDASENHEANGMVVGSRLADCKAKLHHFGPEGPGHIAEKCGDSKGFYCEMQGMTWPVAKPGYWVSGNDPSEVRKCSTLGACPGSLLFGVGSQDWRMYGDIGTTAHAGVPREACLIEAPFNKGHPMNLSDDTHVMRFDCESKDSPEAPCVDTDITLSRQGVLKDCFTTIDYITRGELRGGNRVLYNLQQDLIPSPNSSRCRDAVGSRCCPGNRGEGCQLCCQEENLGVAEAGTGTQQEMRSCNARQWHSIEGGGSGSCYPCPQSELSIMLMVMAALAMLLLAPIIARISAIAKYAGAAQGPVLSVLNFFQSSDLFQSLDLKWPPEFRWFCSEIAGIFNLNLSDLLRKFNFMIPHYLKKLIPRIPAPECAFHLKYETRWLLSVLSPFFIAASVALLIPVAALVSRCKDPRLRAWLLHVAWLLFGALVGSMLGNACQVWHGNFDPENDDPIGAIFGAIIAAFVTIVFRVQILKNAVMQTQRQLRQDIALRGARYCEWFQPADLKDDDEQEQLDDNTQLVEFEDLHTHNVVAPEDLSEIESPLLTAPEPQRRSVNVSTPSVWYDSVVFSNRTSVCPARAPRTKYRCCDQLKHHDYQESGRKVARAVCVYLMIGYVFLAKTSLEPLACKTQLNGRRYISASSGSDIECSLCHVFADDNRKLSYRHLASLAFVAYTVYGVGTPLLFTIILWTNRTKLYSAKFMQSFGFLSSKMREEFYGWEVFISVRKLALVTVVMRSPGQELAMTLINLFITVGAFGAQCWKRPFANVDANVTESATLLCTLLVLILGLGAGTMDSDDGGAGPAQQLLNAVIYVLLFLCISIAIFTLCRRMIGALHSFRHSKEITETEEYFHKADDEAVPDVVREMLHKRKLQLTVAWIGLTNKKRDADDSDQLSKKLDTGTNELPDDRIEGVDYTDKTNEKRFDFIAAAADTAVFKGKALDGTTLKYQTGAVEVSVRGLHDGKPRQLQETEFSAKDGTSVELGVSVQAGDQVSITAFGKQYYPAARYRDLIQDGDRPLSNQERMVRVFRSAKEYQKKEGLDRRLKDFESVFPERLRPALYAWALQKDPKSTAHLMELKWFIDQLTEMEEEQHSVLKSIPCIGTCLATCCTKQDEGEPEFLEAMDADRKDQLFRELAEHPALTLDQNRSIRDEFDLTSKELKQALEYVKTREASRQMEQASDPVLRDCPADATAQEMRRQFGTSVRILTGSGKDSDRPHPHALEPQSSVEVFDSRASVSNLRNTVGDFSDRATNAAAAAAAVHEPAKQKRTCKARQRACALCLKGNAKVVWTALQYFFLGNTIRTLISLIFALFSWWLTCLCLIQWWIDTDKTLVKRGVLEEGCAESRNVEAAWWIVYVGIYYMFVLLLGPLIAAYYNSNDRPLFLPGGPRDNGHRPLFLATRELGRPKKMAPQKNAPNEFGFIAAAGQTSFDGEDLNGMTLQYQPGTVEVHIERSGRREQIQTSNFIAHDGTSVKLAPRTVQAEDYVNIIIMRPESKAGAYQVVRVAFEHLQRYRAAKLYEKGAVVHVKRKSGGPAPKVEVVRATIRSRDGQTVHTAPDGNVSVYIEYPDSIGGDGPVEELAIEDVMMPSLQLPSESKIYSDSLQPEKTLGRLDLNLTRDEADRLVEFVSLRRRERSGQLVATVKLDPKTHRLVDKLNDEAKPLTDALEERRCTVAIPPQYRDAGAEREIKLDELVGLLTGLSSISQYEWLLFVSWLLTLGAIVLDSWRMTDQSAHDESDGQDPQDSEIPAERSWKQLHEHRSIVYLLVYYCLVICVYPLIKFAQERGWLARLEPYADWIRAKKHELLRELSRAERPGTDILLTTLPRDDMSADLLGPQVSSQPQLAPKPEPEPELVESQLLGPQSELLQLGGSE